MKPRVWNTARAGTDEEGVVLLGPDGGDEEALQYAHALANVCDAETLRSLLDGIVLLQRVGGEFYVGAYRIKVSSRDGKKIAPSDPAPGTYLTAGYLFEYDPVAKKTRAATQAPEEPQPGLTQPIPLVPEQDVAEPVDSEEEPAPELAAAGG